MNWISVKDKLPSDGQVVIVSSFGSVFFAKLKKNNYDNNYSWHYTGGGACLGKVADYWCEITEPPEQRVIPKEDRVVGK